MKMKKRLFSLLLCGIMIFSFMPQIAFAEGEGTGAGAYFQIGGETVSEGNAGDIFGDGTAYYDITTNTLTLKGANINQDSGTIPAIYVTNTNQGLNVNLEGNNTITANANSDGINVFGNLSFSGTGSLTVTGGKCPIFAQGDISIDGATVKAITTGGVEAINARFGTLTILNGAEVFAESGGAGGIRASYAINITESTVTCKSTGETDPIERYHGIHGGSITIRKSTLNASTKNGDAVIADGEVSITDSEVTAISENTLNGSGIAGESVSISGGSVEAAATGEGTNAINAWGGELEISDGAEVIAKATNAGSYPALAGVNVAITNSNVTAESGGSNGIYASGTITIGENSIINAKGNYPALYGETNVAITSSNVTAESVRSNGIYAGGTITIGENSIINAKGDYPALYGDQKVEIKDSLIAATSLGGYNGIAVGENGTIPISGSWITTSGNETFEGSISDSVLFNGNEGKVIGSATVPGDVTISPDMKLNFPEGSSLNIPNDVIFTNSGIVEGTIDIKQNGGTLICSPHQWENGRCIVCQSVEPSIGGGGSTTYYDITALPTDHGIIELSRDKIYKYGSIDVTLTPEEGYEVKDLFINGESVGALIKYTVKNITRDTVVTAVFAETEAHRNGRLKAGVQATTIKAWSEAKKGYIKVHFKKTLGYKVDGYEFYRSTKKDSFGKKPFFQSENKKSTDWYKNNKQLKKGTRYFYKVHGYRTIGGEKVYTKWSNIAYRIAK